MAYDLTLSSGERQAFDWVGGRYKTGVDVADLLRENMPDGCEWSDDGDITFDLPEHAAWKIKELAESEDGSWPCFDEDLATKMQDLIDSIV